VRTGEECLGTEGEHITGLMSGSDVSNPCPVQVMPAQAHVEKIRATRHKRGTRSINRSDVDTTI
jgi:hypothetical protein